MELYVFIDKNTAHSVANNNDMNNIVKNGIIQGYSTLDAARDSIPNEDKIDNYILELQANNTDFSIRRNLITITNPNNVTPTKIYRAESDEEYWDRIIKSNREGKNKFANQKFGIDEGLVKLNLKLYENKIKTHKKSKNRLLFERMNVIAGSNSITEDWVDDPQSGLKIWKEPDRDSVDRGVVDYDEETPEGQSGFCKFNPEISKWSLSSADNLAMTLTFVIVSQQQSWGRLMAFYPDVIEYIYREGNGRSFPPFQDGATFSPIVVGGTKALNLIWSNKEDIYSKVVSILKPFSYQDESKKSEDAAFELYKFFASAIHGLGNIKAGFATQLVIGRSGCIDSINKRLFGDQDPKIFQSYDKTSGKPLEHITNYYSYINSISDDSSRLLWDKWTEIISNKLLFAYDNRINQKSKPVVIRKDDKEYDAGKYFTQPEKYLDSNMAKNRSPLDISQQHHPEYAIDTMGVSPDAIKRNKKI